MFSTKLLKLAVDRSLGKPTDNQGELFEELYREYMADANSSSLREQITAAVAGCKSLPGKLVEMPLISMVNKRKLNLRIGMERSVQMVVDASMIILVRDTRRIFVLIFLSFLPFLPKVC